MRTSPPPMRRARSISWILRESLRGSMSLRPKESYPTDSPKIGRSLSSAATGHTHVSARLTEKASKFATEKAELPCTEKSILCMAMEASTLFMAMETPLRV